MQTRSFLKLPLDYGSLISGTNISRCSIEESIAQHLHLAITTRIGENFYEDSFGCLIWEYDFDNTITHSNLKDLIKESLSEAISSLETRISKIDINVSISQAEITALTKTKRIKKRVDVEINAVLNKTGEMIKYYEYFFLGPLSYY